MSQHLLRPRAAVVPGLYHFHQGDQFLPGAESAVFEPAFTLPVLWAFGASVMAGAPFRPTQPPQVWQNHSIPVAGLGGLFAGQFFSQGLVDPLDTTGQSGG